MKNGGFKIRAVTVRNGGFIYTTYRVRGWLRGEYIRRQFKSRDEANGAKLRFEIAAANAAQDIRSVNTRLTPLQLAEAEAAFARLDGKSLSQAVDFFLTDYRPPVVGCDLIKASEAFQAARRPEWSMPYQVSARQYLIRSKSGGFSQLNSRARDNNSDTPRRAPIGAPAVQAKGGRQRQPAQRDIA